MTRPSANLDKKMLDAGLKIIVKEGSKGLTARNICKKANVNLGMFNYWFKSKENYISILYNNMQAKMESFINIKAVEGENSIERLKYVLLKLTQFSEKHLLITRALLLDGMMDREEFKNYMDKGVIPRNDFLVDLIVEAKKDGYFREDLAVMEILGIVLFGVTFPSIFINELNYAAEFHKLPKKETVVPNFFAQRIEIVLKGLSR